MVNKIVIEKHPLPGIPIQRVNEMAARIGTDAPGGRFGARSGIVRCSGEFGQRGFEDVEVAVEINGAVVFAAFVEARREVPAGFAFGEHVTGLFAAGRFVAAGESGTVFDLAEKLHHVVGVGLVPVAGKSGGRCASRGGASGGPKGVFGTEGAKHGGYVESAGTFEGAVLAKQDHEGRKVGRLRAVQVVAAVAVGNESVALNFVNEIAQVVLRKGECVGAANESKRREISVPIIEFLKHRASAGHGVGMREAEQRAFVLRVRAKGRVPIGLDEIANGGSDTCSGSGT